MTGLQNRLKKLTADQCEKCSEKGKLDIHHLDKNVQNNNIYNLKLVCKKCHSKYHKGKFIDTKTKLCRFCEKEFVIKSMTHYYCSEGCRRAYREVLEAGTIPQFIELAKKRLAH